MSGRLVPAITRVVQEAELRQSLGRLGRTDFALRILTITGIAFACEFLGDALLHLTLLPHVLYVLQRIILFGAFGTILLRGIDQRLADAGLPRWCRYPAIAAWLLSVSLPTAWPSGWQIGLGLFLLLLILGCSIRGTSLPTEFDSASRPTAPEWHADASRRQYRPKWFNNQLSFSRYLLTLVCLWLPLIWLESASGGGIGIWFARLGYCVLSFVWFFVLIGRLNDAGRLPRKRYGFLLAGLVLLIGLLNRGLEQQWSTHLDSFLLSSARFTHLLGAWPKYLNDYELLALFLFIQIPVAFLPSKPRPPEPVPANDAVVKSKRRVPAAKTNELALCGPLRFLGILLAIAIVWLPLIFIDRASGGDIASWVTRIGYLVLVFFWMTFAGGRFDDAGMADSGYAPQYFLVVAVASLMPLAVHWVNGYGALAIFVLIQIPTVFLPSKPKSEEPSAGGQPLDELRAGVPRP
ncbi:MAG: hypothetical protein ABR907_17165 [Terracidiphilus sp.]|jgi:hypothetical protein